MKNKDIYVTDKTWSKINTETGEVEKLRAKIGIHSVSDFFVAYLGAWNDFKPTEGMKMRVFIHCILMSSRSNPADSAGDGNIFKVQRVIQSVRKEMPDVSETAIRMNISRLAKDGFVIQTSVRGEYYINPKYGVKGSISERTYMRLTLEKAPVRSK